MIVLKTCVWGIVVLVGSLLAGSRATAGEPVNWSGWYVGPYAGYIWGELTTDDPSHLESTGDFNDDSPLAGLWVMYQRQTGENWVFGAEVQLPLYIQKGTAVDKKYFPDLVTYEADYRFGIFLAGKGGRAYGRFLPYAFGAIGIVDVNGKTFNVDLDENYSPGFEQSAAATHFVWQLGGGLDYAVDDNIFIGARVAAFIGAKADHTMPWNEPGPNMFGYKAVLAQIHGGYRL